MKKYILIAGLMMVGNIVYAGTISRTNYTAGNSITAALQNSNENTIVDEINGGLDSANLEDGSIVSADIAAGGVELTDLASAVTAKFVPTGTVFYWVGSTNSIPSGYLYCNGQAVSRATYSDLFSAVGESFGEGDNSTTFNVPDMRGYFVRGMTDNTVNDPDYAARTAQATGGNTGNNIGSVQTSSGTSHTHTASVTDGGHIHQANGSGTGAAGAVQLGDSNANAFAALASSSGGGTYTTNTNGAVPYIKSNTTGVTVSNTSVGGNETRPLNINMAGIIKY